MVFGSSLSAADNKRLLNLCKQAVKFFNASDWQLLDLMTGNTKLISGHGRLLRSLSFGDDDYEGNVHRALFNVVEHNPANLQIVEDFASERYGGSAENISTALSKSRQISFTPSVFEVPEESVDAALVAVMTPFQPQFEPVFLTIRDAALQCDLVAVRAKDIWQHSVVIQDVFSLIFRSQIVVCDFTGKNPNVFYEAGIAHTLGKHVVPITQAEADIPFDLRHHRFLPYLNNEEGRAEFRPQLASRFRSLV
ncbi:MAG: hypothetical protein AABY88_11445 [Pseudomonadota bacterium]